MSSEGEEFYEACQTEQQIIEHMRNSSDIPTPGAISINNRVSYSSPIAPTKQSPSTNLSRSVTVQEVSSMGEIRSNDKECKEFSGLTVVQEIPVPQEIWAMKFSPWGNHLAVGGSDGILRVYQMATNGTFLQPFGEYVGHTNRILDLAWIGLDIVTVSMDKTAQVWRLDQPQPMYIIQHSDHVTSVWVLPDSPSLFATGSFDWLIRIWNSNTGKIETSLQTQDIITALAISPDGVNIFVGMRYGQCVVYAQGGPGRYKFITQLHCKNRKGPKSSGKKVTSIEFIDDINFLITTNDSRMRLYSLEDFQMKIKYKGHQNQRSMIRSAISHNTVHIISGSDNGKWFIWNKDIVYVPRINPKYTARKANRNKCYEVFQPGKVTTVWMFAPLRCIRETQERLLAEGSTVIISHIILVATDGLIKVYFNQYFNMEY